MTAHSQETDWRVVVGSGSAVGERPVWDEATGTLVWVDILAGVIHRSRPAASGDREWLDDTVSVGDVVGAVALRADGGMVAAVDSHIRFLDAAGRDDADAVAIELPPGTRFNDGVCDPAGRFLVGTAGDTSDGKLFSLDPQGAVVVRLEDITESNGIGWSDDARIMFYVDSAELVVRRYAYDAVLGTVGPRLTDLVDLSEVGGCPDGLTIDADGLLWVPQWGGGELRSHDQAGQTIHVWSLPVSGPTCVGFAGKDLSSLVLATSWEGLTEAERATQPWAGHLLASRTPVRGRAQHRFGRRA